MTETFEFPDRITYVGFLFELSGLEAGRATYTDIEGEGMTVSFDGFWFRYYEHSGLITRRY